MKPTGKHGRDGDHNRMERIVATHSDHRQYSCPLSDTYLR